ncbi:MAG: AAA family ATPase [Desulfuromonadaceae bacterium]|nr:AAA family ATPase [Desulfuromonadaceae bacterium]
MENFFREQQRLIDSIIPTKRYLYSQIDWNTRCIGILGARGTGKTTLMLQHVDDAYRFGGKGLYVSVDSPYFQAHNLFEFAREFHQLGGEALFLDEIHKYPDWSIHIKSIYDSLPDLKVVFSGSSLLQIAKQKGDLSRRAIIYNLHGLSFREYINFIHKKQYPAYVLETIVTDHQQIADNLCREMKILKEFRDYLQIGYYPFFLEGEVLYKFKVREVINHILEVDLPFVNRIEPRQISKIKKLLYLLATGVPFVPNIAKLAEATEISRPSLYEYLEKLQDAKLLNLVRSQGRGYEVLTKPEKILLENSNLMYAITDVVNTGALRELFFVNQLRNAHSIHPLLLESTVELAGSGDFIVNGQHTFEIGGKKKGFKQVSGVADAFVVADDIETGFKNKIPLWIFGFLY